MVADEDEQAQLFKDFNFLESGEEFNVGILDKEGRKYGMEPMEEYDEDTIRDFINQFKKGNIVYTNANYLMEISAIVAHGTLVKQI